MDFHRISAGFPLDSLDVVVKCGGWETTAGLEHLRMLQPASQAHQA